MNKEFIFLGEKCALLSVSCLLCLGLAACGGEKKELRKPLPSDGQMGQIVETVEKENVEVSKMVENSEVETPATYPGGEEALKDFIRENIVFPDAEKAKSYKGVIPVRFKVKEDGTLGEFVLQETICPECDGALIDVMKKVKGFTNAKDQTGKSLAAWWTIEIEFPINK